MTDRAEDISKQIGRRIASARIMRNLTQMELAELVKTSTSNISFWETGTRTPHSDGLIRLCNALNVSADYLLGLRDTFEPLDRVQGRAEDAAQNPGLTEEELNKKTQALVEKYLASAMKSMLEKMANA